MNSVAVDSCEKKMAPNTGTDIQVNKGIAVDQINNDDSRISSKNLDYQNTLNKNNNQSKTLNDIELRNREYQPQYVWVNIVGITLLHLGTLYSIFNYSWSEDVRTTVFGMLYLIVTGFGVTGGAHRFWTHRSYKAKWPLRLILAVLYSGAGMNKIFDWVRDHRVHHKYSETDADPHNATRGFFFAHVGWLMMKKHPEVYRKGRTIDMSDIEQDAIVKFVDNYNIAMKLIFTFLIPVLIPVYGWNETWGRAIMSQVFLRYPFSLNAVWSVNSAAHLWGSRPYDKNINPAENTAVCAWAIGEGFHNYHHVFPSDYKASEYPNYGLNLTAYFIDSFAKIGWAYDLKQPSQELVKSTIQKRGDGTHVVWGHNAEELKAQ